MAGIPGTACAGGRGRDVMRIIKYFGLSFVVFALCLFQFGLIIGEAQPVITEEYDTLENQTVFLGTAETDTQIQCSVYTVDEENQTTLLYQMSDVVGASGIFNKESLEFYGLERLWADAPELEFEDDK